MAHCVLCCGAFKPGPHLFVLEAKCKLRRDMKIEVESAHIFPTVLYHPANCWASSKSNETEMEHAWHQCCCHQLRAGSMRMGRAGTGMTIPATTMRDPTGHDMGGTLCQHSAAAQPAAQLHGCMLCWKACAASHACSPAAIMLHADGDKSGLAWARAHVRRAGAATPRNAFMLQLSVPTAAMYT